MQTMFTTYRDWKRREQMAVNPIPTEGAIPYISCRGAAAAIDFYKKAFGATEVMRMENGGKVGHAELKIDHATIYLADEYPDMGFVGPQTLGGTPVMISIYVKDVDAVVKQAESAGGKVIRPVEDQFYGDRGGCIEDPYGHKWWFATHKEDLSPDEMRERAKQKYGA
jgi:PhnB protein